MKIVTGKACANLYEHHGREGASMDVEDGWSSSYLGNEWNDRISSVKVRISCDLSVWEHINFGGSFRQYTENEPSGTDVSAFWNDKISSAKCECDCVAGDMVVGTLTRGDVETRDLLVGDMIRGLDADMEEKWCVVKDVVKVGHGTLYGNFTAQHLIADMDGRIITHGRSPQVRNGDLYTVFTDCPLMKNVDDVLFTPLAEVFCGSAEMAWEEYLYIFNALLQIIGASGTEWLHIDTFYRNCNSTDCNHYHWRDALPGVCHSMLQCAKLGDDASCDNFENVAWGFFTEHVSTAMYHDVVENVYKERGSHLLSDSVRNTKPIYMQWYFWMSMCLLTICVLGCCVMVSYRYFRLTKKTLVVMNEKIVDVEI